MVAELIPPSGPRRVAAPAPVPAWGPVRPAQAEPVSAPRDVPPTLLGRAQPAQSMLPEPGLPQRRLPEESFEDAVRRYTKEGPDDALILPAGRSAYAARTSWKNRDVSDVTTWPSVQYMQARFEEIRDRRFLTTRSRKDFERRISWLYPDDGCFARAGLMKRLLREGEVELPKRVFLFGQLRVDTPNHPRGKVRWWYHTAPIVKVENTVYVLDPAIEPERPLPLEDWVSRQNSRVESVRLSVCEADTYDPQSNCDTPGASESRALRDQNTYLIEEWRRQRQLGRDPTHVLGDTPPWVM